MQAKLVTVKQCSDPAEAAFFASYLEENGIHVENSVENMKAWSGRYSMLARGPVLKVSMKDVRKARKLLNNPPAPIDDDYEFPLDSPQGDWVPGETPENCPRCGSANMVSMPGHLFPGLLFSLLTLGIVKPYGQPLWICRDCDWDSRTAAREQKTEEKDVK
ncbi:MAG: DUF2007 domain-containing protein [Candidatus Hydrogenedentes bacterium]|nr:DUF2007 domain-containing protein [Candidatus Hydrogenedentota bacterium]